LRWTSLNDTYMKEIMREIMTLTPGIGQTCMLGALRSRGVKVQHWRVRALLREIDPIGTVLRWQGPISRRKYNVRCPNSLWHIDGNHKLIRWRFVIHTAVDGYSRLALYVYCANNNESGTVLEQFQHACEAYGVPSRVRSDHGLENVGVACMILECHGTNRGSIITGSSVHNQRVERLHRDVTSGVLGNYRDQFYSMERCGILDPLNEVRSILYSWMKSISLWKNF